MQSYCGNNMVSYACELWHERHYNKFSFSLIMEILTESTIRVINTHTCRRVFASDNRVM